MTKGTRDNSGDGASLGINEVVELSGISAFTIRYYDKCGFFPGLRRSKRGVRSFSYEDVHQLKLVDALRKSSLSIEGIKYFVRLLKRGSDTIDERLAILQSQTASLEYQIAEAQESLDLLKSETLALNEIKQKLNE